MATFPLMPEQNNSQPRTEKDINGVWGFFCLPEIIEVPDIY